MAVSRTFGPVIAERTLTTAGVRPKTITITLGKPRLPKGERDWECRFESPVAESVSSRTVTASIACRR